METKSTSNFLKNIIAEDLKAGRVDHVITRFPPEPNGYLHIGHAKSIILNFELADEFEGKTHLRFDDTNPAKEDEEYVRSIKQDILWLGYQWDQLFFASDYFEEMYKRAVILIKKGKAYVCDSTAEEIRQMRGSLTEVGQGSPCRDRTIEVSLDLFERMRKGEFNDGEKVLRAKIDMASPNINMRDPVLYRISHASHHNTGNEWCIYPMYDFAHPLEDAIEGITHSICTMEFEDHRPLYDWVIHECQMENVPHQYEFARLNITNTVMSKRKLKQLVDEKAVDGWDDPRMPTISGLRRRGYTPEAIRAFAREIGVAKAHSVVDTKMLEHFIREDLKLKAARAMAVIKPLKVVITNYPEDQIELLESEINPENPEMGTAKIPFSRVVYIEQDDFTENPPPKYHRLYPGNEVRLRNAYFIKCNDVVKDEAGKVVELHCTYDQETKSGSGFTGRKVKGTIHWVEASMAVPAEFRLYEPLILDADLDEEAEFMQHINPNSLESVHGYVEPTLIAAEAQEKFQFVRHGYFNVDSLSIAGEKLVFNRIVSLKNTFETPKS